MVKSSAPQVDSHQQKDSDWEKLTLFVFSVVTFSILLLVALFGKTPDPTSWFIYNGVLALAAGGIAALLPGTLSLNWRPVVRATGALAVAALFFLEGKDVAAIKPPLHAVRYNWRPLDPTPEAPEVPNPFRSDVYVVINSKTVKADVLSSPQGSFAVDDKDKDREKEILVNRDAGGIVVTFETLRQGERISVILNEGSAWLGQQRPHRR